MKCTGPPTDVPRNWLELENQIYFLSSIGRSKRIWNPSILLSIERIGIRVSIEKEKELSRIGACEFAGSR